MSFLWTSENYIAKYYYSVKENGYRTVLQNRVLVLYGAFLIFLISWQMCKEIYLIFLLTSRILNPL